MHGTRCDSTILILKNICIKFLIFYKNVSQQIVHAILTFNLNMVITTFIRFADRMFVENDFLQFFTIYISNQGCFPCFKVH